MWAPPWRRQRAGWYGVTAGEEVWYGSGGYGFGPGLPPVCLLRNSVPGAVHVLGGLHHRGDRSRSHPAGDEGEPELDGVGDHDLPADGDDGDAPGGPHHRRVGAAARVHGVRAAVYAGFSAVRPGAQHLLAHCRQVPAGPGRGRFHALGRGHRGRPFRGGPGPGGGAVHQHLPAGRAGRSGPGRLDPRPGRLAGHFHREPPHRAAGAGAIVPAAGARRRKAGNTG